MIPIIWKVTLSFLQKQMTFALGAALTILQSIYKLQPLQVMYMHKVFLNDKWMTTILFHIQQLRNRHDHVLSEMMTFFMKQIVDDDKKPQHRQEQKYELQQQHRYNTYNAQNVRAIGQQLFQTKTKLRQ